MLQPVLFGGLFIGVLSALPIVSVANCCCLWMIGGGALAAYLDQQGSPTSLTPGRGLLVGALAGVVGAIVWMPVAAVLGALMAPIQERLLAEMVTSARDMPPEARAWLDGLTGRSSTPLRYVFGFAFQFFAGIPFAAIGGLLGAAFFRKDVPPAVGGAMPPAPPDMSGLREP